MLAVIWVCGRCVTELLKFMRGWEWKSFGIKRDIILHYGLWLLLLGFYVCWSLCLFCSFLVFHSHGFVIHSLSYFLIKSLLIWKKDKKKKENHKYTHPLHVPKFSITYASSLCVPCCQITH